MTEHLGFTHAATLGALVDAALAVGVLVVARVLTKRRTGLWELIEALAVSGVAAVVQLALVDDGFGKLHVLYLYVFLTLPILGAAVLAAGLVPRFRPQRLGLVAGGGMLTLAIVGFYATHIEPRWLRTERVSLDVDQVDADAPIRIGVLSDLQTNEITDHEREAVDRMMAAEPDLILVAGDYFQSDGPEFDREYGEMRDVLAELSAPGGVFVVQGDVDSTGRMEILTEGLDLEWLEHEVVTTEVDGTTVHVAGIPVEFGSDDAQATIDRLAAMDDGGVRILLAHRPDAVYEVPDGGADLVVAGHTHGGQVALPFFGPPITLSNVPRDVAAGGLHEVDGVPIYLSTGVGMERHSAPQVRFGVRPSIGVVTLT